METKKCAHCWQIKPRDSFADDPRNRGGKNTVCKKCTIDRSRSINGIVDYDRRWDNTLPDEVLTEKWCTWCKKVKPFDEFALQKGKPFGRKSNCKECNNKKERKRRVENREEYLERKRNYYKKNSGKIRAINDAWEERNSGWREEYREAHKYKNLSEEGKERIRAYARELRKDASYRIHNNVGRRLATYMRSNGLPKGGSRTESLLGYTIKELKEHIQSQFKDGMSWDNYGKHGWHIDHRIPLTSYKIDSYDHPNFKKAWALENLQPMWATENLSKGGKLYYGEEGTLDF
jgi:hypothetical protein